MRPARWLAVLLLAAPGRGQASEVGLGAAVARVGEGRFAAALDAARADPDPHDRAQAELYVLHQGGALEDALGVGLEALERYPEDPWLLDRTAYLALSLGAGELADGLYGRLEAVAPERREALAPLREEARRLDERRREESRALSRARALVVAAAVASVVWMTLGLRAATGLAPGAR